jgi:hypothetical protein
MHADFEFVLDIAEYGPPMPYRLNALRMLFAVVGANQQGFRIAEQIAFTAQYG